MHDRPEASVESISAVTIAVSDMAQSVRFYAQLGFTVRSGGRDAGFTSFLVGPNYLNLVRREVVSGEWGRIIFYVSDVDAMYERALAAALSPYFVG